MNGSELLDITAEIGAMLIEYGAEIYRVEETVYRIAKAYGFDSEDSSAEVFAIPSCLIITIREKNQCPLTRTKRVFQRDYNLDRVDRINCLSREICAAKPSAEKISNQIYEIKRRKVYGFSIRAVSYFTVGATFALFFGGTLTEAGLAGLIAVLITVAETRLSRISDSVFLKCIICSLMTSSLAVLFFRTGMVMSYDKIIIGASMTMVPGITLTNCMRDFIAGDLFAGLYTFTEAIIAAIGMAVGAAVGISVFV